MNNTAKHTPGPWVYDAEEGTVYDVPSDGDAMMLMVSDAGNGNLIAAAPAMYEALAKLRLEAIHYRNTGVGVQFLNAALDQAEDAINLVYGVTKCHQVSEPGKLSSSLGIEVIVDYR